MNQPLDLSIMLMQPPSGSPTDVIASITLRCAALGLSHFGDLLRDPLTPQERDDLRWYLEEYWKWPYLEFEARGKEVEALLVDVGKRLYHTVFGSGETQTFLNEWQEQPNVQRQISIVSEIPGALRLPWELLHDAHDFLALRSNHPISIVRRLPLPERGPHSTTFEPPLRMLLITARPRGAGFVDPRSIGRELIDEVQEHIDAGTAELEFLRPPTLSALQARIRETRRPIHVLHFDGHGSYNAQGKQGMLAFEDDGGGPDLVTAAELARTLHSSGIRLVLLTACQSATSATDDAFSSVAAQLLQGGIDAVVAMSASFLVSSATRYVEAFYRAVAASTPVQAAQEKARNNLYHDPRRHLLRHHEDEEGIPVVLHDWWVPQFYQQHPVLLEATKARHTDERPPQKFPIRRLNEEMPAEPRYGFSGRAREMLQIERSLLRGKPVLISGFGGIGKTALAREATDWLTRTSMYEGACFVSFEHGGNASTLLSMLGHSLGISGDLYNPNDSNAALIQLAPILKTTRMLVIADNLESILPGGQTVLDHMMFTQLWDALLELRKMGVGVLLTSRNTDFVDRQLMRGYDVEYLELKGLHPEDAYTLATYLLVGLKIDRSNAPYDDLQRLLKQLDYHPLAIQLVLPTLNKLPLTEINANFAALLPMFVDDKEDGHNRSLLASLEYSMLQLSQEQRKYLSRIAIFEGGANERDLLEITNIPEKEWTNLLLVLKQAALLRIEKILKESAVLFLRFHPVLTPYLRRHSGPLNPPLQDRFVQNYVAFVALMAREDSRHPHLTRSLVRRELPNLRHAFTMLLEAGDSERASQMADGITFFLRLFGMLQERDVLHQQIEQLLAAKRVFTEGILTRAEYIHEFSLGQDEFASGKLDAAYRRYTDLLSRIEALAEDIPLGRGSYHHCLVLTYLARCLHDSGRFAEAEDRLHEASNIISALKRQNTNDQYLIRQHIFLLTDLGSVLTEQGKYLQAKEAYEAALSIAKQQGEVRPQAVASGQLGDLALRQKDYNKACENHSFARKLFHALNEPLMEAAAWNNLGIIAWEQGDWAEAEKRYKESLAIYEKLRATAKVAGVCNALGNLARDAGRPHEAERWFKRGLKLEEKIRPESPEHAMMLSNLTILLVDKVREGQFPMERLVEARTYAEYALKIQQKQDTSSESWKMLSSLATIAGLEGRETEARDYRRREREAYANFAGNRFHIDRVFGPIIDDIVAAVRGNKEAFETVLKGLQCFERDENSMSFVLAGALRRILAGERSWPALVEDMDGQSALLILRVLERI